MTDTKSADNIISELLAALRLLTIAAGNRDNTSGDAIRIIEVRHELREANAKALAVLIKYN